MCNMRRYQQHRVKQRLSHLYHRRAARGCACELRSDPRPRPTTAGHLERRSAAQSLA